MAGSKSFLTSRSVRSLTDRDLVLYSESNLAISTTGTIEEVLKTVTIPAGALNSGEFSGFSVFVTAMASSNTNQKTVRVRLGGLAGTIIMAVTNDATADNLFQFNGTLQKTQGTDLVGQGLFSRATGSTSLLSISAASFDFSLPLDVTVTGLTPSSDGDVDLTSMRVVLLKRIL